MDWRRHKKQYQRIGKPKPRLASIFNVHEKIHGGNEKWNDERKLEAKDIGLSVEPRASYNPGGWSHAL